MSFTNFHIFLFKEWDRKLYSAVFGDTKKIWNKDLKLELITSIPGSMIG